MLHWVMTAEADADADADVNTEDDAGAISDTVIDKNFTDLVFAKLSHPAFIG